MINILNWDLYCWYNWEGSTILINIFIVITGTIKKDKNWENVYDSTSLSKITVLFKQKAVLSFVILSHFIHKH